MRPFAPSSWVCVVARIAGMLLVTQAGRPLAASFAIQAWNASTAPFGFELSPSPSQISSVLPGSVGSSLFFSTFLAKVAWHFSQVATSFDTHVPAFTIALKPVESAGLKVPVSSPLGSIAVLPSQNTSEFWLSRMPPMSPAIVLTPTQLQAPVASLACAAAAEATKPFGPLIAVFSQVSSSNDVGLPFAVLKAADACLPWHLITAATVFATSPPIFASQPSADLLHVVLPPSSPNGIGQPPANTH